GADSHRSGAVAESTAPLSPPRRADPAAPRAAVAALVPPLLFPARAFLRGRGAAERDRHAVRGGRRADEAPRRRAAARDGDGKSQARGAAGAPRGQDRAEVASVESRPR